MMMEAIYSSEMSVLTRAIQRNFPEDAIILNVSSSISSNGGGINFSFYGTPAERSHMK
jgi:hypothetical protein